MHNCRQTKERLIDLLFREADASQRAPLLAEVEACASCLEEYHSMAGTLVFFDQATEAMRPRESYWSQYNESLRRRLNAPPSITVNKPLLWKRLLTTNLRVPVPVAAAAVLLLLVSTVVAVRSFQPPFIQSRTETPEIRTQFIEVPVIQPVIQKEVVTRTVYVVRQDRADVRRRMVPVNADNTMLATSAPPSTTNDAARISLSGFQPASEVKLTIIKGNYQDEK
jgi:hypothetical protein